jgi:hypothetical protein
MVICSLDWNEKADRAFARSAIHNTETKVSIRAEYTGERRKCNIDRSLGSIDKFAFGFRVIRSMDRELILSAIVKHRICCPSVFQWLVGVRFAPRLHPWDEQELPFPTRAWLNLSANTEEAQTIAEQLFSSGFAKSPIHTNEPTAKCVFVYALTPESSKSL